MVRAAKDIWEYFCNNGGLYTVLRTAPATTPITSRILNGNEIRTLQHIKRRHAVNEHELLEKPFSLIKDHLISCRLVDSEKVTLVNQAVRYRLVVTDTGERLLSDIPIPLLLNNLINGMSYRSYDRSRWTENWILASDRESWETFGFFARQLRVEDAPQFLVHEYPMIQKCIASLLKSGDTNEIDECLAMYKCL